MTPPDAVASTMNLPAIDADTGQLLVINGADAIGQNPRMATIMTGTPLGGKNYPRTTLQKDPMSDRLPSGDHTKENHLPTARRNFRSHAILLWQKHSSKERNVTLS